MTNNNTPKFSTPYDHHKVDGLRFDDSPSMTKQSFKQECDINYIMKRYETTGVLPDMIKANPSYGDFSDVNDYQTSLGIVRHAEEQFSGLSSKIRERFGNDPARFLAFATDQKNLPEMVKMGLAQSRDPILTAESIGKSVAKAMEPKTKPVKKPKEGSENE